MLFKPIVSLHIVKFSSCRNYDIIVFATPILSLVGRLPPPPPPPPDRRLCTHMSYLIIYYFYSKSMIQIEPAKSSMIAIMNGSYLLETMCLDFITDSQLDRLSNGRIRVWSVIQSSRDQNHSMAGAWLIWQQAWLTCIKPQRLKTPRNIS